jgi:hypothetical protein
MKTTILIALVLVLFSSNQDQSKADNYEVINTLEDMKEWMDWDVIEQIDKLSDETAVGVNIITSVLLKAKQMELVK